MTRPLTPIQKEVLTFLRSYIAQNGFSPTLREIIQHFGWNSTNAAKGHIDCLARKGYLRRYQFRARTIVLTEKEA